MRIVLSPRARDLVRIHCELDPGLCPAGFSGLGVKHLPGIAFIFHLASAPAGQTGPPEAGRVHWLPPGQRRLPCSRAGVAAGWDGRRPRVLDPFLIQGFFAFGFFADYL